MNPIVSGILGTAVWVLITTIYAWVVEPATISTAGWLGLLGFLGIAIAVSVFLFRSPLSWKFSDGVLAISAEDGADVRVSAFQTRALNRSSRFVRIVEGKVRYLRTGREFPVLLNVDGDAVALERVFDVPPGAEVGVVAPFFQFDGTFRHDLGVSAQAFLRESGGLSFEWVAEGRRYEKRFSARKLGAMVRRFEADLDQNNPPRVTRRF